MTDASSSGFALEPALPVRYAATRLVINVLRFAAWAVLVVCFIAQIVIVAEEAGAIAYLVTLLTGVGSFVLLLAAAEGLQVVVDIEEHLRALRWLAAPKQPAPTKATPKAAPAATTTSMRVPSEDEWSPY